MPLKNWVALTKEEMEKDVLAGARFGMQSLYWEFLRRINPVFSSGENVYEHDWDLLILLDGCRTDAIEQVADEYEFLAEPGTIRSVASTSDEWMRKTFNEDYAPLVAETVYVTANAHIRKFDTDLFKDLEEVYEWGWDDEHETTPAEPVTDAAIKYGRKYRNGGGQMIVHYMQPHFPSIPKPIGHGSRTKSAWARLWSESLPEDELWSSYIANLRYVLDSVEVLLQNIDAEKVVISADHGNAMGEWGVYEHPGGLHLRCLREVPWYEATASDSGGRVPDLKDEERDTSDETISTQLEALGYRE
jgi:hypothetical protein